LNDRG